MAESARDHDTPVIPNKLYFRIGEVSRIVGVKPYVLRYWETEFPGLNPKKSGSNHRLYRKKDVELLLEIRHLLHEQRFTIEGARQKLAEGRRVKTEPVEAAAPIAAEPKAATPDPAPESQPSPARGRAPKAMPPQPRQGFLFGDPMEILRAVRLELEKMREELSAPPPVH